MNKLIIFLSFLLKPLFYLLHIFFLLTGKISTLEFREKTGRIVPVKKLKKSIWLHVSSIGEYNTSLPLIIRIKKKLKLPLVITYFNPDVRKQVLASKLFAACHFLPAEDYQAYCKIIRSYSPVKLLIFETEVWPVLLSAARSLDLPVYLLYGYLYDGTWRNYRLFDFFFRSSFRTYDAVYARSKEDRDKFISLGTPANNVHVTGDLKCDVSLPRPPYRAALYKKYRLPSKAKIFTAASLHAGEEKHLVRTAAQLVSKYEKAFIILAPRYMDRIPVLEKLLKKADLEYSRRSQKKKSDTRVMILDTFGELKELMSVSKLVFMGGSLVRHGGHNIIEPVSYNIRTFSGPHYSNFQDIFRIFRKYIDIVKAPQLEDYVIGRMNEKPRKDNGRRLLGNLGGAGKKILSLLTKK